MKLQEIVEELNIHAKNYKIGELQWIRKRLKSKKRLASHHIFDGDTTDDHWAFHYGGRKELQFNVGLEEIEGVIHLRYGVAYSLEPSLSLQNVSILYPSIHRFNEFMRLYPEEFPGFQSWSHYENQSSDITSQKTIPPSLVKKGAFIFFGKHCPLNEYRKEEVLQTFDRLLPLYIFVEGGAEVEPLQELEKAGFQFNANPFKPLNPAHYTAAERSIDISFRHNKIQQALFERLCKEHGCDNVSYEHSSGIGNRVDIMLKQGDAYWYYEVKTNSTAKSCIREAIGQLLEYSFWPRAQCAAMLIVVGEPELDPDAAMYLDTLRTKLSIPIRYERQAAAK